MTSPSEVSQEILTAVNGLREEVGQLRQRIAALETSQQRQAAVVDEELILTISAAVAAYLGVKPKIRQIRLVSSPQWTQQGRATIQASRKLPSRNSH